MTKDIKGASGRQQIQKKKDSRKNKKDELRVSDRGFPEAPARLSSHVIGPHSVRGKEKNDCFISFSDGREEV